MREERKSTDFKNGTETWNRDGTISDLKHTVEKNISKKTATWADVARNGNKNL